jgi:hypothetical protein
MQKLEPAPTSGAPLLPRMMRATGRVLAFPVFLVMALGAMLLILTRLYRS